MGLGLVDIVVLVVTVGFAVNGYRNGFVSSILSFIGFFGGAVVGAQLATPIATRLSSGRTQVVVAVAVVLGFALIGQIAAVRFGSALRNRITWRPARAVDSLLGALTGALAALLVAWMVATPLASSPYPGLASAVRGSTVIRTVNSSVPPPVRNLYDSLRRLVDRGDFPDVFGPLSPTRVLPVSPPNPKLLSDPALREVRHSVVKVTGLAPSCSRRIEGSGFVYSSHRVMTNAHVVAGEQSPSVQVDGQEFAATVVVYDPDRDVAVLQVPDLTEPALSFSSTDAGRGADAVIVGYPLDGPLTANAARIRDRQEIRGPNIYNNRTVDRDAYTVRGTVRSGNSGGPLLRPDGQVYGVIFAAALDQTQTGFALTADEVAPDARAGVQATTPVDTGGCD